MQVNDVILAGTNVFKITGIYIGAEGVQNLVGIESLNRAPGYALGKSYKETLVPEELLLFAGVYRRVE